ncbi:MAG: hypothetical protein DPW18_03235 [Chloroflexi bacterium]|nr:hypothetical protein [Chloroflexota bacterium]MDL1943010.1 hypothetical protein [Chloroflexi bacterium CFX2]
MTPFISDDTGSFLNFRSKILKKMKASHVSDRIAALLLEAFESALGSENTVISKAEKKILMADISNQLLADLAKQIKDSARQG